MSRKGSAVAAVLLLATAALLFAAIPDSDPGRPHAPFELFGVGPEMFGDRVSAWIETIGGLCEKAIAKLGIIAAAIFAFVQNVKQRRTIRDAIGEVKERVDRVAARADTNAEQIQQVALQVPPPTTAAP